MARVDWSVAVFVGGLSIMWATYMATSPRDTVETRIVGEGDGFIFASNKRGDLLSVQVAEVGTRVVVTIRRRG